MSTSPYIANEPNGSDAAPAKLPDWREGVAILMERAWLGVLVAVVVFLFITLKERRQVPYYRSTAVLLVEAQIPRLLNYQDVMAFNVRNLEYFNSHINALHSRKMMENALVRSGLVDRPGFLPEQNTLEAKIEGARRFLVITPVEKTRMIRIAVEHPDPQVASDLANGIAQAYIQQDLDNRMSASMEAIEWLRARAEEYRQNLERGLLELQQYREKTESVSLEEDQNIVIEKLKALNSVLTSAQAERIQAETTWKSMQAQIDEGTPLVRIASLLGDAAVLADLQNLQGQQREVVRLQQRYRDQHPDLQQALELEQKLHKQFEQAGANAVHALKSRYEMLVEREGNLQNALREQEQEAFELDRKLVRYNELKRNLEADQGIHQAVISRMKEASISESMPSEIIRLAEEARPARTPFRPQIRQAMGRGIGFGLVLGVAAIFLFYYADHRFRRNEEIERLLGIPVLATIPLLAEKTVEMRGMISHLNPGGEVAESFRTLRASLSLKGDLSHSPILMLTSAGPADGKSLIASNLAISFAQDGRHTLLVGADLRRPVQAKVFGLDPHRPGLAELLDNQIPWQDAVEKSVVPHLDVLTSGRIPSRPSELLGQRVFFDFLREARGAYDHIIIDAPPVLGVSDSLVLLPNMDGVLFVVRYGATHSMGGRHAMLKIQASGTPVLGCIMNGVNLKSLANYYYYRRYGGYAYRNYQSKPSGAPPRDEG
jgi:polysaccharide biosynthesis transport protein